MEVAGLILGVVAISLAVPPFLQWAQGARRWLRRRDPLRLEVSPHRLDDRVIVTVTNRGDRPLTLGWAAMRASDKTEPNLQDPDIFGEVVQPDADSDGFIFVLVRERMPPTDSSWVGIHVFDKSNHHRYQRIPARLSKAIERPRA